MGLEQLKPSWQESSGGITHPILRLTVQLTVIGRDIDAAMEQNKDSRNRATEIQSLIGLVFFFQSLIVGKSEKAIQWREEGLFNKCH